MPSTTRKTMLINGHQLYVETSGPQNAPLVVLLHHGLGAVPSWSEQVPALVQAGYRTLVYDRWGYGKSDSRSELSMPFFPDDLEDLKDLLDEFGVERVSLVGHSDGGTIALYFAARYTELVTSMVVVAAHIYVEPKMQPGIEGVRRAYENQERFRQGLQRLHGDKTEQVFYNWFGGWTSKPENTKWDMRPVLKRIECPVLVVQGFEDEHATPQHARDIAEAIPQAGLWVEPGAGHMLPQETPQEFNQRMIAFLDETMKGKPYRMPSTD
jgi:pimeloyl-ACP methyl ester carboxylesterase